MIYLSLDCEAIGTTKFKGPTDLESSARSIVSFTQILEKHQLEGEFFITPEAANNHRDLFKSLSRKHKLSLHLHLGTYQNGDYFSQGIELGNLSKPKQQRVLKSALADFEETLQIKPYGFRPGMGSANSETIELLSALGINHGSLSIPGLKSTKYNFDWRQWSKFPHTIETRNGHFHNLPLTGNFKLENHNKPTLLSQIVESYKQSNYIAVYAHNWVDFSPKTEATQLLNDLIAKLKGNS